MNSPTRIYVPADSTALSLGADEVAAAVVAQAALRAIPIELIRNGSRGLSYLDPLLEVEIAGVRHAYGPVMADDVAALFQADFLHGGSHPLALGATDQIDYLKRQTRFTFARAGLSDPLSIEDYQAQGGYAGLRAALAMSAEEIVKEVLDSGLRGRGGAAFPTGIKWQTVARASADQKYIVCNADEGDSGTFRIAW